MILRTGIAALAALSALSAVAAADPCPGVKLPPIALPHMQKALAAGEEVTIVAFGSSSTEGSHASDKRHTYPATLQIELETALPNAHIAVLNRGVGGQDAPEMIARLETDVLAIRPTVVIWQVGANSAMRGIDPAQFRRLVDDGVRQLTGGGADVILMDNQRSPAVLASPIHTELDQALADVAKQRDVRLFARGRLMGLWEEAGFPNADFLADDGIHHNDRGYACVARALAQSMIDGLGPPARARLSASQ